MLVDFISFTVLSLHIFFSVFGNVVSDLEILYRPLWGLSPTSDSDCDATDPQPLDASFSLRDVQQCAQACFFALPSLRSPKAPISSLFFFWTMPEFVSLRRTTGKPKETRWRLKAKRRSSLGMGTHVHTYLLVYVWSCLELFRDRESAEFWLRNLLKI